MKLPTNHGPKKFVAGFTALALVLATFGSLIIVAPSPAAATSQNSWRWRNDDGTEQTATWATSENTAITGLDKNAVKRLRFGIANDGTDSGFARQDVLNLQGSEGINFSTAVIDSTRTYAYFGTSTSPSQVVKVRLSDFTRVAVLTFNFGENSSYSAFIDAAGNYAYFVSGGTTAAVIVKIRLSDFSRVGALSLGNGELTSRGNVYDPINNNLYLSTNYPSANKIMKVDLSSFTELSPLSLTHGEGGLSSAVIDSTSTYAYFGSGVSLVKIRLSDFSWVTTVSFAAAGIMTMVIDSSDSYIYAGIDASPARIYKVKLSNMTSLGSVLLTSGENTTVAAVIDSSAGYAYFSTYTTPGIVVKISLGSGDSLPTRIGGTAMGSGETLRYSAAVDVSAGLAYYGVATAPGKVLKVSLGAGAALPSRLAAVSFTAAESTINAFAIDTVHGYAYVGTWTSSSRIIKIRLSDFTRVGSLDLNSGEDHANNILVDAAAGFAYVGTNTAPGIVVKIALGSGDAAPTRVGAITLNSNENWLSPGAVIDTLHGYAYFGTGQDATVAKVIKIKLADFSRVGSISLSNAWAQSAVIDPAAGYAYFGMAVTPTIVTKVALGSGDNLPSEVATLPFSGGERLCYASTIDTAAGYAYFETEVSGSPSKVVQIRLSDFSRTGTLSLDSGETIVRRFVIDPAAGYLYVGMYGSPAKVVRVKVSDMSRAGAVNLNYDETSIQTAVIDTAAGYAYFGTADFPNSKVVKLSVADHFAVQYATKPSVGGCAAASGWTAADLDHGAWRVVDAAGLTAGAATTNVTAGLTDPPGSFVASSQVEGPAANLSLPLLLGASQFTEVEFGVRATPSAVDGATYCFRLANENSVGGFTHSAYAEAAVATVPAVATTANSFTATRLSVGSSAAFGLTFALPGAQSTPLTVYFPNGFTVNSAFTSGTCSGGGTIGNFAVGPNGTTITADKSACAGTVVLDGASITLPAIAGLYTVRYVNDSPGEVIIPVTDADFVSVTGNVDPTLTFDLDVSLADGESGAPYAVDLGGLTSAAPSGSNGATIPSIWLDLETNAASGALVTVKSANGSLKSTSAPADLIASSTEPLSANNEGYGLCVQTAAGTLRTEVPALTFTAASPYDQVSTPANCSASAWSVGLLQTSAQNLLSATGPLDNGRVHLRVAASAANSTPAHPDYTDILTFIATATY